MELEELAIREAGTRQALSTILVATSKLISELSSGGLTANQREAIHRFGDAIVKSKEICQNCGAI